MERPSSFNLQVKPCLYRYPMEIGIHLNFTIMGNSTAMEAIMDAIAHSLQLSPSRESSMVKTKLDEARLWLIECESMNGIVHTDIIMK